MKRIILSLFLFSLVFNAFGQDTETRLKALEVELATINAQKAAVESKIEGVKLEQVREDLKQYGLPAHEGEEVIEHLAMSLVYSEDHEQAKWVAHIIRPEVMFGKVSRTNDFREDPLVKTGTCVEKDYFLKYEKEDGKFEYDGFGYDRGHLAPSADFRWSQQALSESYFYSNMSPQLGDFNRGIWADLEGQIRGYIYRNPTSSLYIVTGPILKPGLPVIERSINKPSIPERYFKVAVDLEKKQGIGFILANEGTDYTLESFIYSIDEVEKEIGYDLFPDLPDDIENIVEAQKDVMVWLPSIAQGDVEPMYPPDLPKNHFNTIQSKQYMGQKDKVNVCGTVVSARTSQKGNILMNLDKKFPNDIFTVFIRKENIPNFSYDPEKEMVGEKVCSFGEVISLGGTPAMFIKNENQLKVWGER